MRHFFSLLYINDFRNFLNNSNALHYVDDTLIFSAQYDVDEAIGLLNYYLSNAYHWFNANKLKLNVDKTQFIIFSSRTNLKRSHAYTKVARLHSQEITFFKTVNFVGVVVDLELNL